MAHGHDHDHGTEMTAVPSDPTLRVKALESLLVEKGLVDPAALDAIIDMYERQVGPRNGARVVAKAWSDPAYKARLLEDATEAILELGFSGAQGVAHREEACLPAVVKDRLVRFRDDLAEAVHAPHVVDAVHRRAPLAGKATFATPIMESRVTSSASSASPIPSVSGGRSGITR